MGSFPPVLAMGWHCPGAVPALHLGAGLGPCRVNERHVQGNTQTMQPAPFDEQIFTTRCGKTTETGFLLLHGPCMTPGPSQDCVQESEQPRAAPASPYTQAQGCSQGSRDGEESWAGWPAGWGRAVDGHQGFAGLHLSSNPAWEHDMGYWGTSAA